MIIGLWAGPDVHTGRILRSCKLKPLSVELDNKAKIKHHAQSLTCQEQIVQSNKKTFLFTQMSLVCCLGINVHQCWFESAVCEHKTDR